MTNYRKKNRCSLYTIVCEAPGVIPLSEQVKLVTLKACLNGTGASLRVRGRKPVDCPRSERNYCGDIPLGYAMEMDVYVRVNDYGKYHEYLRNGGADVMAIFKGE